ncbi:MAG: SGNH/GDSL hydrolase family protein [bacterium]
MKPRFPREVFRHHPRLVNASLVFISLVATLIILEGAFRVYLMYSDPKEAELIRKFSEIAGSDDTRTQLEPHPYLAYAPAAIQYEGEGIRVRGRFFPKKKNAGVIRVACLGGSTTAQQFPPYLEKILNRFPGDSTFEVMDFGCNGWTMMESTINYLIRIADFAPDIVLTHHGVNDGPPRLWPGFKPDYSHFRKTWNEPPLNEWTRKTLSQSWLMSHLMRRLGMSAYDVQNLTMRRVGRDELLTNPPPETLEPFARNLRLLGAMVRATGGRLLVAPMPHDRSKDTPREHRLIEECNAVQRRVARELGLRLAETDGLLRNHPEWFKDICHLVDNGNYLKAQVYALVIWDMLGGYKDLGEMNPVARFEKPDAESPEGRDLELRWELDSSQVREFQIHVRVDREKAFRYMGRTFTGDVKTFRWKAGAPELAPSLKDEFRAGPRFGHFYTFKVAAVSRDDPPRIIGHLTGPPALRVYERPLE